MSPASVVPEERGPAVSPSQDPASVFLEALWNLVRGNLGLAALIGGVATTIPLMQIFGDWGLPFVQFVGVQDLIFPGFVFALIALTALAFVYVLGTLADLAMAALPFRARAFLSLALIIVGSATWIPTVGLPTGVVTAASLLVMAAAGQVFIRSTDYAALERPVLIASILAVAGVVSALVIVTAVQAMSFFADAGFAGQKWLVAGPDLGCQAQLLWYGEKSVVLRCDGDEPLEERIRVLSARADLVFTDLRPAIAQERSPVER